MELITSVRHIPRVKIRTESLNKTGKSGKRKGMCIILFGQLKKKFFQDEPKNNLN